MSDQETTKKGVSEQDQNQDELTSAEEQTDLSQRDLALKRIVDARKQDATEDQPFAEEEETIEDELEEEVVEEDIEEEDLDEEVEPEILTIKVNGRMVDVEKDKVEAAGGVEAYQKQAAASEKLRQASEREADLNKREAELKELEASLLGQREQDDESELPENVGEKFTEDIFEDGDSAAQIVDNIVDRLGKVEEQSRKVAEDAKKAEENEQAEAQRLLEETNNYYVDNHNDIASDEDLHFSFNRHFNKHLQAGMEPSKAVDKAAEDVRAKFNVTTKKSHNPKDVKKKMNRQPKRASGTKPPPQPEKRKSRVDTLNEMRKSRGVGHYS